MWDYGKYVLGPFFCYDYFDVVRDAGPIFSEGCDSSVSFSVVLESLISDCGYFFCCSVACLVCSACKVISSFVVPCSTMLVVVVDEADVGLEGGFEGFVYRFHVMHVVLDGGFACFGGCDKVDYLRFVGVDR